MTAMIIPPQMYKIVGGISVTPFESNSFLLYKIFGFVSIYFFIYEEKHEIKKCFFGIFPEIAFCHKLEMR